METADFSRPESEQQFAVPVDVHPSVKTAYVSLLAAQHALEEIPETIHASAEHELLAVHTDISRGLEVLRVMGNFDSCERDCPHTRLQYFAVARGNLKVVA